MASALLTGCVAGVANATTLSEEERESAKEALVAAVDKQTKLAQVMNDMIFSFGELGFQEVETSKYRTAFLEEHGISVE